MNWEMHYDESEKIIFIKTNGVLEIKSADVMRSEGVELIKKYNCMRCLLDHRDISKDALATMDIYELPKRYAEIGIPRQFKIALIVPEQLETNLKFYETVCRNNGFFASIFVDYKSALDWLKK